MLGHARARGLIVGLCAAIGLLAACSDDSSEPKNEPSPGDAGGTRDAGRDASKPDARPPLDPDSLDSLGLFEDAVAQVPARSVIPYDVNAVLFADEAEKLRFVAVPEGQAADYDPMAPWTFPEGTRFVKTFFYYLDARDPTLGRRLLETRIIELSASSAGSASKWTGRTYVWNDEQTEARRLKTGRSVPVQWIDATGEQRELDYLVPNDNECKTCHSQDHVFEPLGPRTRQLNRERDYGDDGVQNQIDHWVDLGVLRGADETPKARYTLAEPYGDAPLEQRARAYLDANCSHCHRPGGEAGSTALDLRAETEDPYELGACRTPSAAGPGSGGHSYDVVPGHADDSILVFRMESTDPKLKMPELPTVTSDAAGVALIRAFIDAMPARTCN